MPIVAVVSRGLPGDEPDLVEHVEVPDYRQHRDDYQARLDQRHGDLLVAAQL